ncbi:histidine phosphatase family protein [Nocardioides sp. Kera G14]|uniref:histidine phosphatase family protein n=1 Tax=Nocardioides sp. Kera G14 TaxID=2884264 RepID=UPI001D1186A2|nr:histidine phosphatase family protein [Nocardioides sp. Kera G14]UDY24964.1 histidine phosphatase family protein [Nocardioides sp. Kera G14]
MGVLHLVRHGQASFGADDYDVLSTLGHEQSRLLGRSLAARGLVPERIVRGEMRRHRETLEGILEGLGGAADGVPVEVDAGWDEFDFGHVIDVHHASGEALDTGGDVQAFFEQATSRWSGGAADHEYDESFSAFVARVGAAAERSAAAGENVLVVTSGGPIALAASSLLTGDPSLWMRLNRVAVNTAVTKVISGRAGLTLSTYNAYPHLEHERALVTYR